MRGREQSTSVEVNTSQVAVPTRQAVHAATLEPEMNGINKSLIHMYMILCFQNTFSRFFTSAEHDKTSSHDCVNYVFHDWLRMMMMKVSFLIGLTLDL